MNIFFKLLPAAIIVAPPPPMYREPMGLDRDLFIVPTIPSGKTPFGYACLLFKTPDYIEHTSSHAISVAENPLHSLGNIRAARSLFGQVYEEIRVAHEGIPLNEIDDPLLLQSVNNIGAAALEEVSLLLESGTEKHLQEAADVIKFTVWLLSHYQVKKANVEYHMGALLFKAIDPRIAKNIAPWLPNHTPGSAHQQTIINQSLLHLANARGIRNINHPVHTTQLDASTLELKIRFEVLKIQHERSLLRREAGRDWEAEFSRLSKEIKSIKKTIPNTGFPRCCTGLDETNSTNYQKISDAAKKLEKSIENYKKENFPKSCCVCQ